MRAGRIHAYGSSARLALATLTVVPFFWSPPVMSFQNPVEQQSPLPWNTATNVTNPTGCNWDVDDYAYTQGRGDLTGTTATRLCLIADGSSHDGPYSNNKTVTVFVTANSPDLRVTLNNTAATRTGGQAHVWAYTVCTVDTTPGPYPDVPGSNGGKGVRVDYTLTIAAGRKARVSFAELKINGGGC